MIISDPKGQLYDKYSNYLRDKGDKRVMRLNLIHPEAGAHYNPMAHCRTSSDYRSLAHTLAYMDGRSTVDPFWDEVSANFFAFILGMLVETRCLPKSEKISANSANL